MSEKNRFSRLLKHLMTVAGIKNYALAQELKYDVSYISKWTGGQMIPSEKYASKILKGISECIVTQCGAEAATGLMQEYQVENKSDLQQAIWDNLEAEYNYVRDLQNSPDADVILGLQFWPEMKIAQFVVKMRHPVLRRVSSLNIVGAFDIFALEREYQLQIIEAKNKHVSKGKWYQDVHYYMVINVQKDTLDYSHDISFLVEILDRNRCIDFHLYGSAGAAGKAIFAVEDDYMISGLLVSGNHCVSVVTSENSDNCRSVFRSVKGLCSQENQLFRKTSMREMILKHEYVHGLFALCQQWIIGHLTEHFLPEDLFEEIVEQIAGQMDEEENESPALDELRSIHRIARNAVEDFEISILLYRTAFYNLVVDNEIDFFNYKVHLTQKQIIRCLEYFIELCRNHQKLKIKMVSGRLIPNMDYETRYCILLNDTISHIRLDGDYNNMYIISRIDMRDAFVKTFYEFWENRSDSLITDREIIIANVEQVINGIKGNS